jgi:carbonic anhydrase
MSTRNGINLVQGNLRFQQDVFEVRKADFERLVEGQQPRALYVGCSDSRVVAEMILDVQPGELFVVRNIGAIVPHPEDPSSTSLGAALDYAIGVLEVPDIVVCGHDLCGALQAIVRGNLTPESHLERWLRKGSADVRGFDLLDHHREMPIERLVERFVAVQVETLQTYDVVRDALAKGKLRLHGAVYDPHTGRMRVHQPGTDLFAEFHAIERRSSVLPHTSQESAA